MIALVLTFAVDAPLVGRPVEWPFSGAVARFVRRGSGFVAPFEVSAAAEPTTLDADRPVVLTVTLTARGPVLKPPTRLDLRQVPAIARSFHIADEPDEGGRWRYRLVPRGTWVREVPGVPVLFFNPDLSPPERGYQLLLTDPIPLTVRPAEKVGVAPDVPPEVLEPAADVSGRRAPWRPGWGSFLAALFGPPAAGAAWYAAWRRWNPDAARIAHLRRNRAARRAIDALARAATDDAVTAALAGYLAERFEPVPPGTTPDEAAAVLRRANLAAVADRLREAWRRADEGRFAAAPAARLTASEATALVLDIEEAACPSSS